MTAPAPAATPGASSGDLDRIDSSADGLYNTATECSTGSEASGLNDAVMKVMAIRELVAALTDRDLVVHSLRDDR